MKPWKISGAGNTFLLEILDKNARAPSQELSRKLCDENAVDGYLALLAKGSSPGHYEWAFFNRDGSLAEFCGNAARCAQHYVNKIFGIQKAEHHTSAGLVLTWQEDHHSWVQMPTPQIFNPTQNLSYQGQVFQVFWCDTGVPHIVVEDKGRRSLEVSRALRFHSDLGPRGANVTWVQCAGSQAREIQAVTYERGVEDYTQACGTGAFAAALAQQSRNLGQTDFEIQMPGGKLLLKKRDSSWIMTGPVHKLGEWRGTQNES